MKYLFMLVFGLLMLTGSVVTATPQYIHEHDERLPWDVVDIPVEVVQNYAYIYSSELFRPPALIAYTNSPTRQVTERLTHNVFDMEIPYWLGDELIRG